MALTDCGMCVLLANCDAQISNAWDFYTFASKMLCEIAENTGGLGPSEDVNLTEVGGVAVTIGDFQIANLTQVGGVAVTLADLQNIASVGGVAVTVGDFQDLATVGGAAVTIADFQQGNVPHDSPDSGNPLKIGYRARTSDITAVANDDRTDSIADKIGRLVIAPYSIPEDEVKGTTAADMTGTTTTQVIAAVASRKLYITSITVSNMSAAVATRVDLQDGSGGTVIWQGPAAAAGGGFAHTFTTPISTTSGNGLFAVNATTGAAVRVSASGYSGV